MRIKTPFSSTFIDYPDNESIAVLLYIMGCEQNCEGCHNPDFKNEYYNFGTKQFENEELITEIEKQSKRNKTNKIVFSGGDPLFPNNLEDLKFVLNKIKNKFEIMIYTSYEIEHVIKQEITGFSFIKCGVFNKKLFQEPTKNDDFIRFASKNQNLYNSKFELISDNGIYIF